MKELQTVALGLIVLFVDIGDPDWIADPLGWLLILVAISALKDRVPDYGYLQLTAWVCLALSVVTWPPDSVPVLDDTMGWVFSLPTLAFCFLLADSLCDVTVPDVAQRFRVICWAYALVAFLPLLPLLLDWTWLETPATVLAILINVAFVIALFSASDDDALPAPTTESSVPSDSEKRATTKSEDTTKRSTASSTTTKKAQPTKKPAQQSASKKSGTKAGSGDTTKAAGSAPATPGKRKA